MLKISYFVTSFDDRHRGRKRPIYSHSSSSPEHLLQIVNSGIFRCSTRRFYRLEIANFLRIKRDCQFLAYNHCQSEIANFLRTISHVGISTQLCDLYSPRCPLPVAPSLWFSTPPFPVWISTGIGIFINALCNKAGGPQTDKYMPQSPFLDHFY